MATGIGILGFAHGHVGMYCAQWKQMTDARLVVPTWDSTEDESTGREPYYSAIKDGRLKKEDVAELGAVILGEAKGREAPEQTVVFDVGRINIWAVAVTYWAYEWAREREIGTPVSLSGG